MARSLHVEYAAAVHRLLSGGIVGVGGGLKPARIAQCWCPASAGVSEGHYYKLN